VGTTRRGLAVSTDDDSAVAALDRFTDRLAGIRLGADAVLGDAGDHPEVASLQLAAAMLWRYGQTATTDANAAGFLAAAHALEPGMNERERRVLGAMDGWATGELLAAAEAFEAIVAEWPRDVLSLKALEFLYYVLGQHHLAARFLATVEAIADPNADDADFLAVWAFAAELSGDPDRAADLAERSLAIEPHTPWAHHALAHVFIARGDDDADVDRLAAYMPVWQDSARVIHAHNAWHLAVARLDGLDFESAMALLRDHVWGFDPDTPGEQIDAISLLWRLELAGETQDDAMWSAVADHVERRVDECVFPFLSAHHAYALARAGRLDALDELRASVRRRTDAGDAEAVRVWRPIGQPVVDACVACGLGEPVLAAERFDGVIAAMPAIGGSDAQDDVFRQAYLHALTEARRRADAAAYWSTMTAYKKLSALEAQFRARIG
jgi:tetratricopeptide (TPR) repeat protein